MANPSLDIIYQISQILRNDPGVAAFMGSEPLIGSHFPDNETYPRILVVCALQDYASHTAEGYQGNVTLYIFTRGVDGVGVGTNLQAGCQAALQDRDLGLTDYKTLVLRGQSFDQGFLGDGLTYQGIGLYKIIVGAKT